MPNMPNTIYKSKPKDPEAQRVYKEYFEARRRYVICLAYTNRLFYVQTGDSGEGQHYVAQHVESYEDGTTTESYEEIPTRLVHDLTYIEEPYFHDVALSVRLGPKARVEIDCTARCTKFMMSHQSKPDFDSLDALDEHFRQFIDTENECA